MPYFVISGCLFVYLYARGGRLSAAWPVIDRPAIESVTKAGNSQREKCYRN